MKLLEYASKEVLSKYGVPVKKNKLCKSLDEVKAVLDEFGFPVVIKAQVPVGGRGKAGGIKVANNKEEAIHIASQILNMEIKGLPVKKVLVEEAARIKEELYLGIVLDRGSKRNVVMVSKEGGVEIEEVARTNPEAIVKLPLHPYLGLQDYEAKYLAFKLSDNPDVAKRIQSFIKSLYRLYVETDAQLAEINPLVIEEDGNVIALDAKIIIDDNALYRHPELEALRDMDYENPEELEAKAKGLSFVKLDGNIGCCVNGAGLAMATMDVIKLYGGEPANFLDVGGSSSPEKIKNAMELILRDKRVKAIFINIFGGITRCDDVATGLVQAYKELNITLPIVIRLTGTNEDKAKEILNKSGLPLYGVSGMAEGAKLVSELASK
uniref:Succinate--CoA ligase [ADP-forming] subunit beta n=1 Tax=candidate division WOR-3 bacterium TaxID=2052148 RepID=A0A7V3ZYK0_UNCW3